MNADEQQQQCHPADRKQCPVLIVRQAGGPANNIA